MYYENKCHLLQSLCLIINTPRQQQKSQLQMIFSLLFQCYYCYTTTKWKYYNSHRISFTSYQQGLFFFNKLKWSQCGSFFVKFCGCKMTVSLPSYFEAKELQNTRRTKRKKTEQEHLTLPRATKEGFPEKLTFECSHKRWGITKEKRL